MLSFGAPLTAPKERQVPQSEPLLPLESLFVKSESLGLPPGHPQGHNEGKSLGPKKVKDA